MIFEPPSPANLKAMAGWALSRRRDASNVQALALDKFRDGCGELAENYPPVLNCPRTVKPAPSVSQPRESAFFSSEQLPEVIERIRDNVTCKNRGDHRFNIHTQKCMWCSKTYREVRGRKSELM